MTEPDPMPLDLAEIEAECRELLELAEKATGAPWHTVGDPWLPRDQATYIIAGHHDPHIGVPICDALEPDSFEGEDDADLERREQEARAQSDANMAFIARARTAAPSLAEKCLGLIEAYRGYGDDWRALYETIGLSRGETDAHVVGDRIRELVRAEADLKTKEIALSEAFSVIERAKADRSALLKVARDLYAIALRRGASQSARDALAALPPHLLAEVKEKKDG